MTEESKDRLAKAAKALVEAASVGVDSAELNSLKESLDSKLNTVTQHISSLHEDVKKMTMVLQAQQKQQILEFAISCAHLESFDFYYPGHDNTRKSGDLVITILKYFALNNYGFSIPTGYRVKNSKVSSYDRGNNDKEFRTKLINQIDALIRRKSRQVYKDNGNCTIYYS